MKDFKDFLTEVSSRLPKPKDGESIEKGDPIKVTKKGMNLTYTTYIKTLKGADGKEYFVGAFYGHKWNETSPTDSKEKAIDSIKKLANVDFSKNKT